VKGTDCFVRPSIQQPRRRRRKKHIKKKVVSGKKKPPFFTLSLLVVGPTYFLYAYIIYESICSSSFIPADSRIKQPASVQHHHQIKQFYSLFGDKLRRSRSAAVLVRRDD
jgi:hypothetical protein